MRVVYTYITQRFIVFLQSPVWVVMAIINHGDETNLMQQADIIPTVKLSINHGPGPNITSQKINMYNTKKIIPQVKGVDHCMGWDDFL